MPADEHTADGMGFQGGSNDGGQFNVEMVIGIWIHCAKCLPTIQTFGVQDPYVVATALPSKKSSVRTKCDEDGGNYPVWESQEGSINVGDTMLNAEDDTLLIEVWNANLIVDEIIGSATVPLKSLTPSKTRLGLQLSNGGIIECSFSISRKMVEEKNKLKQTVVESNMSTQQLKQSSVKMETAPCSNPVLQVEIQRAEKLRNPSFFSTLAPYTVVKLDHIEGTENAELVDKYKGGKQPVSQRTTPGKKVLLVPGEGQSKVKVEVWNEGFISDELIGETEVSLDDKDLDHEQTVTTQLNTGGEVELSMGWAHAGVSARKSRALSAARPLNARQSGAVFKASANARASEMSPNGAAVKQANERAAGRELFQGGEKGSGSSIAAAAVVNEGSLLKQSSGMMKRWQKRYFVLTEAELKYYETAPSDKVGFSTKAAKAKATISLHEVQKVTIESKKKCELHVCGSVGAAFKSIKLRADTLQAAQEWVAAVLGSIGSPSVVAERMGWMLGAADSSTKKKGKKGKHKEDPELRKRLVDCCRGIEEKMAARRMQRSEAS